MYVCVGEAVVRLCRRGGCGGHARDTAQLPHPRFPPLSHIGFAVFFSIFFTLAYFDGEGGQALCFHFKMYYMSSRERELENVYFESVLQHWLFLFHKMEPNMIILAYLSRVGTLKGIYLVLDCSFPPSFAVGRDRKLALVHTTKSL